MLYFKNLVNPKKVANMLEIIVTAVLSATVLNIFLKTYNIPTIIGYIVTGTAIAYAFGLHGAAHSHELKTIAEFGVVFLMFTIGLEFSVKHLRRMKKEVFLYGGLQVLVTASVIALAAAYGFGLDGKASVIIGAGLALSSTAIVLKLLNESGDINKEYGRKSLGILLFQDIAVIPILLMITLFSSQNLSLVTLFAETLLGGAILFAWLWLIGKYLLEPFLYHISKIDSNEIFVSSVLLLVIAASYFAHLLGFSYSLGAFAAGMMIAETHYRHQVEADLVPFRDLLLGVFFVTVGMQIDFAIISNHLAAIGLLLAGLVVIKVGIIYALLRFASAKRIALKCALALFQLGEFGLVVFELANGSGLIEPAVSQVLIVVVVISMVLTPFVFRHLGAIADTLMSEHPHEGNLDASDRALSGHVLLIGYGRLGKNIARLIEENGLEYIAIEQNIKEVKEAQKQGKPVIYGNAAQKEILKAAGIKEASAVIISLGNSEKMHLVCTAVNALASNAKTIVKVNRYEEKQMLSGFKLSHVVVETEETARSMFDEIRNVPKAPFGE